jgi:hypothetical protein
MTAYRTTKVVMPGLLPGIHVFPARETRTWMAGIGVLQDAVLSNGYARP